MTRPAIWMNRRVEAFELIDDVRVRRRVSLDFTLPAEVKLRLEGPEAVEVTPESLPVVPLTILRKRKLRRFDLRDEQGGAVPVLTTTENGLLGWASLCQLAEMITGEWPKGRLRHELLGIAMGECGTPGQPSEARDALEWLQEDEVGKRLLDNPDFRDTAVLLETGFVLFAEIEPEVGRRRVLKLSYDEPLRDEPKEKGPLELPIQLGWRPYPLEISLPAIGTARSFHFELGIPDGLEVVKASLEVNGMPVSSEALPGSRTHLGLDEPRYGTDGSAVVHVRAERQGFLSSALLLGIVTAVLLSAGFARLDVIAADVEAVGPVLLIVPALLAAFLVRPGEHALAGRILSATRISLTLAGLANVLAAAILIADLDAETRCLAWLVPLFLAAIGVVVPLIGWLATFPQVARVIFRSYSQVSS